MAVYIFEPDAFKKMVAVEREAYREWDNNQEVVSFKIFLEKWEQKCKPYLEDIIKSQKSLEYRPKFTLLESASIYGIDGWHRYLVCKDGEILFHDGFSGKEGVLNAKEAGFNIF